MLMIVAYHFVYHGGGGYGPTDPFNKMIFNFLSLGGKIGVNIYFMISAYFIFEKDLSWKQIIKTILPALFYGIVFFIIFSCAYNQFNVAQFFTSIFAFITEYWFVAVYLLFLLTMPIFGKIIKKLSQKTHLKVCIIGFLLCFLIPIIIYLVIGQYVDCYLTYFYIVFPISYIKLYVKQINKPLVAIILIISYFIGTLMGLTLSYNPNIICSSTLTNFAISLSLFLLFKDLKFSSPFINFVAQATFGVYLIHDNGFVRPWLWQTIFNFGLTDKWYWFLFCIATTLAIYIVCTLIELARIYLFAFIGKWAAKIKNNIKNNKKSI